MSEQTHNQTRSQRHRQLLRQGDASVRERLRSNDSTGVVARTHRAEPEPEPEPKPDPQAESVPRLDEVVLTPDPIPTPDVDAMPVIVPTVHDRLVVEPPRPTRSWRSRAVIVVGVLAVSIWIFREPFTEFVAGRLAAVVATFLGGSS